MRVGQARMQNKIVINLQKPGDFGVILGASRAKCPVLRCKSVGVEQPQLTELGPG